MKLKLVVNNNQYYFDENVIITENYNEQLDTLTGRISHIALADEPDLEPFDRVQVVDEDEVLDDRYMLLDSYVRVQEGFEGDSETISYDITLVSETKALEGTILPNLSITPLKENKRNISYYLSQYLSQYGEKIRNTSGVLVAKYHYSDELLDRFNNITCPELQWNNPTLREVITDLLMVDDCIPVVRNNEIDFIDLTEIKGTFTNSQINYIQKSRSSDDYLSEIRMDMQNALNTSQEGVNSVVVNTGWQPFSSNEYIMTSENILIKTQYPILNIKHLWIGFPTPVYKHYIDQYIADELICGKMIEFDLCNTNLTNEEIHSNLVYEEQEYKIKELLYKLIDIPVADSEKMSVLSQYQNFCFYYNRGSKEISGFNNRTKEWFSFEEKVLTTIRNIIAKYPVIEDLPVLPEGQKYTLTSETTNPAYYNFSTYFFKIEYETMADSVFSISKDNKPRNERTIVDNQTNSWVDPYNQSFLEWQKANRMGNEIVMFNQRVDENSISNLVKIGYKKDDIVIYQTQWQIHSDHIECNSYGTKSYILQNYFTGIKSKVRTWRNAQDEAFIRHELDKNYLEFSFANDSYVDVVNEKEIENYMLTPLSESEIKPLKYGFMTYYGHEGSTILSNSYICNFFPRYVKNSLLFSYQLNSNTYTDESTKWSEITLEASYLLAGYDIYVKHLNDYGGIPLEINKFVNSNYETEEIFFIACNDVNKIDISEEQNLGTYDENKELIKTFYKYPQVDEENFTPYIKLSSNKFTNKDNKEIPALTMQYEFISNDNVYITDEFIKNEQAIRTKEKSNLNIYMANANSFVKHAKMLPDDAILLEDVEEETEEDLSYTINEPSTGIIKVRWNAQGIIKNGEIELDNLNIGYDDVIGGSVQLVKYEVVNDNKQVEFTLNVSYGESEPITEINIEATAIYTAIGGGAYITVSNNCVRVNFTNTQTISNKCLYVGDENENVWLGINLTDYPDTQADHISIYLNLTKKRS